MRRFGLTTGFIIARLFGVALPFIFSLHYPRWPWAVCALLVVWALAAPAALGPVYQGWMRLGILISRVTTPVILTLVFIVAILPMALVMKVLRKDPMRRKLETTTSYPIDSHQPDTDNLERPY